MLVRRDDVQGEVIGPYIKHLQPGSGRRGFAEKPRAVSWRQFFGTSALAGIGFTISLFFVSAAFHDPTLQTAAKLAILLASVIATVIGSLLIFLTSPGFRQTTRMVGASRVDQTA